MTTERAITFASFEAMYEETPSGLIQRPKAERIATVENVTVDLRERDILITANGETLRFKTADDAIAHEWE